MKKKWLSQILTDVVLALNAYLWLVQGKSFCQSIFLWTLAFLSACHILGHLLDALVPGPSAITDDRSKALIHYTECAAMFWTLLLVGNGHYVVGTMVAAAALLAAVHRDIVKDQKERAAADAKEGV